MESGATFETLVDAHFKAWRPRNAAPELRDWHARRLAGLQKLFAVAPLEDAGRASPVRYSSFYAILCRDCLEQAVAARSVFQGFLEVPGDGPLRDFYDRHADAMNVAELALTAEIHATFTDALGLLFPEARTRVFTTAQMKAAGLGEAEPCELDWV